MKARMLLAGGNFDTAKLRIVWAAFDIAWGQIAPGIGSNPEAIEAARMSAGSGGKVDAGEPEAGGVDLGRRG